MSASADAAEQVARIILDGTEEVVKLTGLGAKNLAILVYSVLRQQKKTKGAARLESMLRSGKPLKVYTFADSDLKKFKEVAKKYGVLYTVLQDRDSKDGVFDVMVRADDESKIARIVERFKLVRVNTTDLRAEIIKEKQEKETKEEAPTAPETEHPEMSEEERLAEDIMSKPIQKEEATNENPTAARTDVSSQKAKSGSPSERSSTPVGHEEKSEIKKEGQANRKPSVRKKMENIRQQRTQKTKVPEANKSKGSKAKER